MKMGSSAALRSFILLTCALNGNIILHGQMDKTYNDIQLHEHEYLFVHFTIHGHGKEKLFKGLQMLWKVGRV